VLSVAVLEHLLVYVMLNVALAMVALPHADALSLPGLLGLQPASALGNGYYVVSTLAFFALAAVLGPGFVQRLASVRVNVLHRSSPLAFQFVLLLGLTSLAAFLGVSPIFGALVAGILAGDLRGEAEQARQTVQAARHRRVRLPRSAQARSPRRHRRGRQCGRSPGAAGRPLGAARMAGQR
jgi:Kef-type K+ transport system membrane component KefB